MCTLEWQKANVNPLHTSNCYENVHSVTCYVILNYTNTQEAFIRDFIEIMKIVLWNFLKY